MSDTTDIPSPPSAQDLLLTLFGDYLLERSEPVWVGHLIELLDTLDVTSSAVRTALSRMAGKGWLEARRVGRRSDYSLTSQGRHLLESGRERIHRPPRGAPWDGKWSVITYSVPEKHRELRDKLRVRLTWLGCGALGNGVWISPHDMGDTLEDVADDFGIQAGLHVFRGAFRGPGGEREMVARCWDLSAVDAAYRSFLARYRPVLDDCRRDQGRFGRLCPAESFLFRFGLIHEYRRFPFLDPYLPREFLPQEWAGDEAAELFQELHGLLAGPAEEHVDWVLSDQASRRTA